MINQDKNNSEKSYLRLSAEELFKTSNKVEILHKGEVYLLTLTSKDKLILTK